MAGAFYLLSAIAAGVPILFVSANLIVDGDAAATATRILAGEAVFRVCMVSELAGALLLMLVVRGLHQLLHKVNQAQAGLMVTLVLLSIPISFVNVLNEFAALELLHGAGFLAVFAPAQRDALALLCLDMHGDGVNLANIFWGLWLLPFGAMALQSGILPRLLGAWLILDGLALVAVSLTAMLAPAALDTANRLAIAPELGELFAMLWLLIRGAKDHPGAPA